MQCDVGSRVPYLKVLIRSEVSTINTSGLRNETHMCVDSTADDI